MAIILAIKSPIPTRVANAAPDSMLSVAGVRASLSRYRLVDALVTVAVMAWFGAVAGWMVGELHAVPAATMTIPAAAGDMPVVLPRASATPGHPARATIRLI